MSSCVKGMSNVQVETPGYIFKLSANGVIVTYHAEGDRIVLVTD